MEGAYDFRGFLGFSIVPVLEENVFICLSMLFLWFLVVVVLEEILRREHKVFVVFMGFDSGSVGGDNFHLHWSS